MPLLLLLLRTWYVAILLCCSNSILLPFVVCRMANFFCWFIESDLFCFSSFTRFYVPLGSTVSHLRSRFAYILGNYGHVRSQGGRQPATANPSLHCINLYLYGTHLALLDRGGFRILLLWPAQRFDILFCATWCTVCFASPSWPPTSTSQGPRPRLHRFTTARTGGGQLSNFLKLLRLHRVCEYAWHLPSGHRCLTAPSIVAFSFEYLRLWPNVFCFVTVPSLRALSPYFLVSCS